MLVSVAWTVVRFSCVVWTGGCDAREMWDGWCGLLGDVDVAICLLPRPVAVLIRPFCGVYWYLISVVFCVGNESGDSCAGSGRKTFEGWFDLASRSDFVMNAWGDYVMRLECSEFPSTDCDAQLHPTSEHLTRNLCRAVPFLELINTPTFNAANLSTTIHVRTWVQGADVFAWQHEARQSTK